jgi:hypothetical protein
MRKNLWTLGIILLLFSGWSVARSNPADTGDGSGLILQVQAVKPDYAKGEAVELTFNLQNVSQKKVLVARTFQLTRYIDLEISDQHGKRAGWCGRVVSQTDSMRSFTTLAAGGSVSVKLAVSCVNRSDPGRAWGYVLDDPGTYVIKATYRLPQTEAFFEKFFPMTPVVRGPISAEPLTIDIK